MRSESITILGSTGSIGVQALNVAEGMNLSICGLTAGSRISVFEDQIRQYHPQFVAVADEKRAAELKIKVADTSCKVLAGPSGVAEVAAAEPAGTVLNAIVGIAGLRPSFAAVEAGKELALANKESLVTAGSLLMGEIKRRGLSIFPVDSEHSAIFQCLQGAPPDKQLKSILLTASGGPFFGKTKEQMQHVTPKEAVNHPNWNMGAKISVDSATMMNKGLEIIEAAHLFDIKAENIHVLVHRESIVHSMVEFIDNSVLAQLSVPDMRIPIQYALTHPHRIPSPVRQLSWRELPSLTFCPPDEETFGCLKACRGALQKGGLYPAAVNGANEEAVGLFLKGKIKFLEIERLVCETLEKSYPTSYHSLDEVEQADQEARAFVNHQIKSLG